MDYTELIQHAKRILETKARPSSILPEAIEFLRIYAGEKSSFYKQLADVDPSWHENSISGPIIDTLNAFIRYLENGLYCTISLERVTQIGVVSDYLDQANRLLNTNGIHPAAPCMIIGASLEEFLRAWTEELKLTENGSKPSIDTYSKMLRSGDYISKQDIKDITSWTGLRNAAAHGEWEKVNDHNRVSLMVDGVNLFIRKYSK